MEVHHQEYALEHGVRALQSEAGLTPDGVLGPLTRAAIDARTEAIAGMPAAIPEGKGCSYATSGPPASQRTCSCG